MFSEFSNLPEYRRDSTAVLNCTNYAILSQCRPKDIKKTKNNDI